jgi:hypothetical protein
MKKFLIMCLLVVAYQTKLCTSGGDYFGDMEDPEITFLETYINEGGILKLEKYTTCKNYKRYFDYDEYLACLTNTSEVPKAPVVEGKLITPPFLRAIHLAFTKKQGITLKPEIIYFIILNEIATHIKNNPEKYKDLFTEYKGKGKKELRIVEYIIRPNEKISHNSEKIIKSYNKAFRKFKNILNENIPNKDLLNCFDRTIFTTTKGKTIPEIVFILSLMNAASPYYEYIINRGGGNNKKIPGRIAKINLNGTKEDWIKIIENIDSLSSIFKSLGTYFENVKEALKKLAETFNSGNVDELCKDMYSCTVNYKYGAKKVIIGGWVTKLFANLKSTSSLKKAVLRSKDSFDKCEMPLNEMSSSISHFYAKDETDDTVDKESQNKVVIAGIIGIDVTRDKDGHYYLEPKLGYGVLGGLADPFVKEHYS